MAKQRAQQSPPSIMCPHCKKGNIVDLTTFKRNFTQIVRSKCKYCRGDLFVCLLLLGNKTLGGLNDSLKAIQELLGQSKSPIIH